MEVVGSASNVELLAGQWLDLEPDITLIEATGEQFEAIIDFLAASQLASEATILVLSDHFEPRRVIEALRAGVRAVLPSDISAEQLVASLEAVAAGLVVMHPTEVGAMFPLTSASQPLAVLPESLTRRETEVLQMLASGLANKEIAARFAISEHTVKFHVASILGKLGAGSRTEAVTLGIRRGLVLL
jgi:NarL family two-component system response regulator YdfI